MNMMGQLPGVQDTSAMALQQAQARAQLQAQFSPVARAAESDMQYNNAISPLQQDKIVGVTGNNVSKALSVDPNALNRIM